MGNYSTDHAPTSTPGHQRPGNASAATGEGGTLDSTLPCAFCGRPFTSRKPWARFCCPTCRAHAHDAKTGRRARLAERS